MMMMMMMIIIIIIITRVEQSVEWVVEETVAPGENLVECRFAHHKSHRPDLGSNPGRRRGGKPATHRLRYGTAMELYCLEVATSSIP
jgi:hypothetical protein